MRRAAAGHGRVRCVSVYWKVMSRHFDTSEPRPEAMMMQPSTEKAKARPHTSSAQASGASGDWELFLLRLRYREGRLIQAAANRARMLAQKK